MTEAQIREKISLWEAAEGAVLKSKSYTIDGLTYTRQDASTIREQITHWNARLAALLSRRCGSFGVRRIRPLD